MSLYSYVRAVFPSAIIDEEEAVIKFSDRESFDNFMQRVKPLDSANDSRTKTISMPVEPGIVALYYCAVNPGSLMVSLMRKKLVKRDLIVEDDR